MCRLQLNKCRKILVTRPAHQADNLVNLIERTGGTAIRFPLLRIEPVKDKRKISQTIDTLNEFDWLIFTSANAVNFTLAANNGKIPEIYNVQIAAIGSTTARTLVKKGLKVDLKPEKGFNSEALLACRALQDVKGLSILIIRGIGGRTLLAETLAERGAKMQFMEVYERVKPQPENDILEGLLDATGVDIITITSVEALHNLLELTGLRDINRLLLIPMVVISERIKKAAEQFGFVNITVSASPSDSDIINTVTALINGD